MHLFGIVFILYIIRVVVTHVSESISTVRPCLRNSCSIGVALKKDLPNAAFTTDDVSMRTKSFVMKIDFV